jgi:hypothetical protein
MVVIFNTGCAGIAAKAGTQAANASTNNVNDVRNFMERIP